MVRSSTSGESPSSLRKLRSRWYLAMTFSMMEPMVTAAPLSTSYWAASRIMGLDAQAQRSSPRASEEAR